MFLLTIQTERQLTVVTIFARNFAYYLFALITRHAKKLFLFIESLM